MAKRKKNNPNSPTWDARSRDMSNDDVVLHLNNQPPQRILKTVKGFARIIKELATDEDNKQDLLWASNRLRLIALVLEQKWQDLETKKDSTSQTDA